MMRANYPPPVLSDSPAASSADHFKSTLTKCASIGAFILPIKCSATSSNCNGIPEHPLSEVPRENHSIKDSSSKTPAVFPISSIELTSNKKASLAHCKARSQLQFEKERNDGSSKKQRPCYKKSLKKRLHPKKSSKKRTTPKRNRKATQTLLAAAQASPSLLPSSKIQKVSSNDPEGLSGGGPFGSIAKGVTIALAASSGLSLPSPVSSTALGGSSSGLMPSSSYSAALAFISNPGYTVGASELGDEDCLVWPDTLVGHHPDVRPPTLKFKQVDNQGRVDKGAAYLTFDEANRWANGEAVRGIPALGTIKKIRCSDFGSIGKSSSSEPHILKTPELPQDLENLDVSTFTVKKFMVVNGEPLEVTWRLERGKSAPLNRDVRVIYGDSEDRKRALEKRDFRYYNSDDEDLYVKPENFCHVKVYKTKGGQIRGRFRDTGTPRTMRFKFWDWDDDKVADFNKKMEENHSYYDDGFEVKCPPDISSRLLIRKFYASDFEFAEPSDGLESMDEKPKPLLSGASLPETFLMVTKREEDYLAKVRVRMGPKVQDVETFLNAGEAESFQNYMKEKGVDPYDLGNDNVKYWPSSCLKLNVKDPDAEFPPQEFATFVFTQPEKALRFPKVGVLTCVGLNGKAVKSSGFTVD